MAQLFNRSSVYFLVCFFYCKFGWNFIRKAKLNGFGQRNTCGCFRCFAEDSIILFWFIRRKKMCVWIQSTRMWSWRSLHCTQFEIYYLKCKRKVLIWSCFYLSWYRRGYLNLKTQIAVRTTKYIQIYGNFSKCFINIKL